MRKSGLWKKTIIFVIACALVFIVGKIYKNYSNDNETKTLYVFNWSDYIDPEIVEEFESKFSCKVCIDTFDDNESMLAKMQAGATGYDIIFPSSYVIPVLRRNGLIQELNMDLLPNVSANFDNKFKDALHEDSFKYSVPYAFSITGIAYREDKVVLDESQKNGDFTWDFMASDSLNGKTCIMNDIREVIGVGLKHNGFSTNSENEDELNKAVSFALELKKCARRLDSVEYRVGLVNASFYAAMAYNSDIFQITQENPDVKIKFIVPKEGSNSSWDEMCITATSKNVELAHKFIDFLYDAKIAARNIEYVGSAIPNSAMQEYMSDEIKGNPMVDVPKDILERVELIQDVGDSISIYNRSWDFFMSTR